ncbi:hypothetical protein HQN88_21835 [Paenibacillus qinlingensis]|nr:hypothetical protein [Paenibacillus qinlingensis]
MEQVSYSKGKRMIFDDRFWIYTHIYNCILLPGDYFDYEKRQPTSTNEALSGFAGDCYGFHILRSDLA